MWFGAVWKHDSVPTIAASASAGLRRNRRVAYAPDVCSRVSRSNSPRNGTPATRLPTSVAATALTWTTLLHPLRAAGGCRYREPRRWIRGGDLDLSTSAPGSWLRTAPMKAERYLTEATDISMLRSSSSRSTASWTQAIGTCCPAGDRFVATSTWSPSTARILFGRPVTVVMSWSTSDRRNCSAVWGIAEIYMQRGFQAPPTSSTGYVGRLHE
jgi:hypothetical protein